MKSEKIFVGILSVINIIGFIISLLLIIDSHELSSLLLLLPFMIGLVTYTILIKVKKYEKFRSFKYANIATIIPLAILLIIILRANTLIETRTGGVVAIDPVMEKCWDVCQNVTNTTQDCVNNCIQKVNK